MNIEELIIRNIKKEFIFCASRSSGPGGQSVNKLNSKVELRFNIHNSLILSDTEKQKLLLYPSRHLLANGELVFISQEHRTQLRNKNEAIEKFYQHLNLCFTKKKNRKPTRPSKNSKEKRLNRKKKLSELKKLRKKPRF